MTPVMTSPSQAAYQKDDRDPAVIRSMFESIAPRYDITNTVLSGGIHHLWKRKFVRQVGIKERVLDLCTGTGDLVPLLRKRCSVVVGGDFCFPMLQVAEKRGRNISDNPFVQSDAMALPFQDESFDAVTVAFGIRNIPDLEGGLREILRVLKIGGELHVLEFGHPKNLLWRYLYGTYSRIVMPWVGGILTGDRAAYEYLPQTAAAFPCRAHFCEVLWRSGFKDCFYNSLTGGIAYTYIAKHGDS